MLTITTLISENAEISESFYEDEFDAAIEFCEEYCGFEGEAWEMVKETKDLAELQEFLADDGVDAIME